jgi:hypothetical protein
MTDFYSGENVRLSDQGRKAYVVTPSDLQDLPVVTRGVNVETSGEMRVTYVGDADGSFVTITVAAGIERGGRFKRIWSTGNTCGRIVAIY